MTPKPTTLKEITGNSELVEGDPEDPRKYPGIKLAEHQQRVASESLAPIAHSITSKFIPGNSVWIMVNNKAVTKKVTTVTIRLVPFPEAVRAGYDIRIELLMDETDDWNKDAVASIRSDEGYCFHTKADLLASL